LGLDYSFITLAENLLARGELTVSILIDFNTTALAGAKKSLHHRRGE